MCCRYTIPPYDGGSWSRTSSTDSLHHQKMIAVRIFNGGPTGSWTLVFRSTIWCNHRYTIGPYNRLLRTCGLLARHLFILGHVSSFTHRTFYIPHSYERPTCAHRHFIFRKSVCGIHLLGVSMAHTEKRIWYRFPPQPDTLHLVQTKTAPLMRP